MSAAVIEVEVVGFKATWCLHLYFTMVNPLFPSVQTPGDSETGFKITLHDLQI